MRLCRAEVSVGSQPEQGVYHPMFTLRLTLTSFHKSFVLTIKLTGFTLKTSKSSSLGGLFMAYEIFTRKRSVATSPSLNISTKARVSLNGATTALLKQHGVEFILLMWDAELRRIALRPVVKKDSRAYGISYTKSNSMFTAKMFLEHIGYDYSQGRSLPVSWNETESIFEIDIPEDALREDAQAQPKLPAINSNGRGTSVAARK